MGKYEKEKTARRKVLKGIVELRNVYKIPSVIIWLTDSGPSFFGTNALKQKATRSFNCTCACSCTAENENKWPDIMEEDERSLLDTDDLFDPGMDLLDWMEVDTPIQKLPMKLDLMVYNELAKWLRPQIIRSRHERGYEGVKIGFKDPSWCPSFWPSDICQWVEVSNFSRWKSSEYTGEGDLTDVLKKAVENRLQQKGLDPEEHVSMNVDKSKEQAGAKPGKAQYKVG